MKLFHGGAEIRLTKADLEILLIQALNQNLFILVAGRQQIKQCTIHPANKYVLRVTVEPEKEENKCQN